MATTNEIITDATIYTCKRCGFRTDISAAIREHYSKQLRGYDPCKAPPSASANAAAR